MQHSSLIEVLTILQLVIPALALPLRPPVRAGRAPLLRRAYSVVAVDGGAAATSVNPSYTESLTLTVFATKTIDRTTTISPFWTNHGAPATILEASTRTISEPGPITSIATTLTRGYTLTISLANPSHSSVDRGTSKPSSSIVANPIPLNISRSSEATTLIQTSTATILAYGIPPIPKTQSYGAGPPCTGSLSWNSTTVSSYGPAGTAPTAHIPPSSRSRTF